MALAACSRDRGAPRFRPMPKVDGSPALRGGGAARSPRIASYKIEARLDAVRHQITATETLTWTNTGDSAVDVLPFHLYLNAFKNEQSVFMRSSRGELRSAKATDTGWGYIQIDSVHAPAPDPTGKRRFPTGGGAGISGDKAVAELPLPQPVAPGAQIEV